MKILNSFDTKLDEHELLEAIKKYGTGNAILTKRHWVFLIAPLCRLATAMLLFCISVLFSWYQYYDIHPSIFWSVSSAQFSVTLIWIIHSVQIIFHMIRKYRGRICQEKITSQELKEGKFEWYLRHSFLSLVLQMILIFVDIVLALIFHISALEKRMTIIGGMCINGFFLIGIYFTIFKLIDYEMDFNIFTPEQFVIYRQHGILKTETTSIATSTVKMVKEVKQGFWGALWGYGKLSIHPEGGANNSPPVRISYVSRPEILVKKLNAFIDESKRMRETPLS
ncbi:MAG: hypothetical protein LBP53_06070 [Candidatus Peribacteria bacterium]|nr:hypothetical protein [Candidatus Peribacteria bacterium]